MSEIKSKRGLKKKRYTVPIIILILLIAFRLYLPTLVKNNINRVLANIPGYYGQVEDIDISLIRGAYVINGMYLNKGTAESQVPFLKFPKSDISIEWKSLFKGKIMSEIIMTSPEVVYVFEDQKEESGDANVDDWTKALTDIVPIDINHFEVHNGKVAFVQLSAEPNIDLQINNLELTADNLRNVVEKERILPSRIRATGVSIGKGKVSLEGNMNLVKEIPDMDLSFSLENAEATALNDFTNYYAGIDFEKGTFGVYSEVAIADGHLIGYVKPLLNDTQLIGKEDGFIEVLWEGFVGFFKFLLKNQGTDTLATKVPFEGDLNNVEAGVWPTVINIFENAWIKAFTGDVDGDIEFKDAFQDENLTGEQKRELRKIERQERRAQRKKEREAKKG
ncbi:DUF748 domain-containing protein [Aequorivita lipolytica]|uniref:DUF748 domain-containing protein n=1 Tax=Aequorivita lipolytica TaxID=153267 RepID=A0A5C6YR24_9FLAO|nr:DUF748 domain-containing protein [Aequorivita lipolytica]TXD69433.1 DUF748 domain-containing protein [Aequorivita lipolytica]SRX50905.1 hypothetical protein AEQU2_01384 [Aequorivita lipolytica]